METAGFCELTAEQVQRAANYLKGTRNGLFALTEGLSDQQWRYKPAKGGWSVLDVVEHLALIEGRVAAIIGAMGSATQVDAEKQSLLDAVILAEVPIRKNRVEAPAHVQPTGCWSGWEALAEFARRRDNTLALLSSPVLRGRVVPHPVFGPWDGYQWILAVAGHTARHMEQIREVMREETYPKERPWDAVHDADLQPGR